MSDTLFALVTDWGAPALTLAAFLSCLALPVPTSLMMLAAGAFIASGDLAVWSVLAGAWIGAVIGDQAGFGLGRVGGQSLTGWMRRAKSRRAVLLRAETAMARHGTQAVFLSRWLFSPLGPHVNFLAGAARVQWARFTLASMSGEAVWVGGYVGLGYGFGANLGLMAEILANFIGLLSAGVVALLLGAALLKRLRPGPRRAPPG